MKAMIQKFKNNDTGAASVIEMTLIFPLVLFIMGFLIYVGTYMLTTINMYSDAQRIALAAARESSMSGYVSLYGNTGVTASADFKWKDKTVPAIDIINEIMKKHEPYRYIGNKFLKTGPKQTLQRSMENLVKNGSFLSESSVRCTITTENNVLNQLVHVRVIKYVNAPGFVQYLGLSGGMNIDITATAVVSDPAEFIRNTDMVFDLTEYIMEKTGLNEKIAIFKQKFADVRAKLGIKW